MAALTVQEGYDPERVALVKRLPKESNAWVGQYAQGGSSKKLSARSMYAAVDAVAAHIKSNGLGKLPTQRAAFVKKNLDEALTMLDKQS